MASIIYYVSLVVIAGYFNIQVIGVFVVTDSIQTVKVRSKVGVIGDRGFKVVLDGYIIPVSKDSNLCVSIVY